MCKRLVSKVLIVLVAGVVAGSAQAGIDYADPPGGWAYIYTGDQCATQFDAALDGKWHHYDAGSGGSDAWDGSAPGQMGAPGAAPSPGGAGIFADGATTFLRIQDCGDPRDAGGGWAEPSNRKITLTHNITNEVPNGTSIVNDGVTLSFRARIPTTAPLDPIFPDGGGGPLPWVTSGYNIHDDGYGAFGIKQGRSGLGIVCFSLAMDDDEGDISGNGLTMNKRNGTTVSGNVDSYDSGGTENTLTGFDPTQWHEFWIQIVGDTSGGGTHKVTIWMDGDVKNSQTFHVTAGTKHEGTYSSWDGYLVMSLGRTNIPGSQDVDFFGYKAGLHDPVSFLKPGLASNPSPADAATDVPTGAVLSWTPGEFADSHDVYFGTSFDDVNQAGIANPLDVLVSQGQDANTYDPAGLLELGKTYYWRVDEVNAPPDSAVYKGKVWSFATEPIGLPIANVIATASSFQPGMGPENTVNGSGLDQNDGHSTDATQMWLSTGVQPNWIQFEFDKAYKLHGLWVWNSNQALESIISFGAKGVAVEYSSDGVTWVPLDGAFEIAKGPGVQGYVADTKIDFGGVTAKYVKLTIDSTWSGMAQCGLSEVRFFYIPVQARNPQPATHASDLELDVALSWRSGRGATSHSVYFSSDRDAVVNGTVPATILTESSLDVTGLALGTSYYWRVDETDDAANPNTWEGEVWSFTTKAHIVVDDFESYTNDSPDRVFQTWIDGWGFSEDEFFPKGNPGNGTGSMIGYDPTAGNIMETTIFHGGRQSMPMDYNNTFQPYYSEAERTWPSPRNWAVGGADTLVLYVRGQAPAFIEDTSGVITMGAAGTDIWNTADQFRFAHKKLTGNGVIVAKVESLERSNEWAKAGVMIRESMDPGSRFAAVYITPDYGCRFQARTMTATAAVSDTGVVTPEQTAIKAPYWIKLERTGDDMKGYYSADGKTWTPMAWNPQTITMAASEVYIGLALTGHTTNPNVTTTAVFSNVAATGSVAAGAWQVDEIGIDHPSNDAEDLYVMIQDTAGKSATVTLPDGSIASTWTEWQIPFNQLGGVNMSAVKKMVIGAGDRKSPKIDGAGRLYIDDIRVLKPTP